MDAYTRKELDSLSDAASPERGQYCERCKGWIPEFAELSAESEKQLRELDSTMDQIKGLVEITGCPLGWAKRWVYHPHGPNIHIGHAATKPCPQCGENLRTAKAKQCLHCGAHWH